MTELETTKLNLSAWKESRMTSIPLGGLFSRNSIVYKWKAPFRSWMLREAVCWRLHDLLDQSLVLHERQHGLGARILLRSGFETLSLLIYLNHITRQVLDEKMDFHGFSDRTIALTTGSKDGSTEQTAVNVLNMLDKAENRYPGVRKIYDTLSETAHPNWEGLCLGYSNVNHDEYETNFSNRWMELYGGQHVNSVDLCIHIFHYEYNEVWPDLLEKLENWIEANDSKLEATKKD